MIPIQRTNLTDDRFEAWSQRASEAMERLIDGYQPGDEVKLTDDLYKAAKPFLLELFHQKCAYCECVITANQPGDVEHYRPKGRIRELPGKVVKVRIHGEDIEHPGYWWLAYDWSNLLPSCIDCNRRRRHGDEGVEAGKAEFFDVRGPRAVLPGDPLPPEEALLLDPSSSGFDPSQHFEFNEDGTIKPVSEEARYSCQLLGLNVREQLVAQRQLAYFNAKTVFSQILSQAATATRESLEFFRRQINDMWEGRSSYSAFARTALEAARQNVEESTGLHIDLPLR